MTGKDTLDRSFLPEYIDSKSAMLIDIQYAKPSKSRGLSDYLYIIWKDMDTGKKTLDIIPEPPIKIYFEKPELRNYGHNKNYEHLENLVEKTVKAKDVIYEIANDSGEVGKKLLRDAFERKDYKSLNQIFLYPYVFGADYDAESYYRVLWKKTMDNDRVKKLTKGFMDIEVDGVEVNGMPSAQDCPINAITLIDENGKTSYTFLLTNRPFESKVYSNSSKKKIEADEKRRKMYEHMHEQQAYMIDHPNEVIDELHSEFDENYGELDYKIYFYDDERKMLVHFWTLVNRLKLDIIGVWNIAFDIPYIIERLQRLGLDPKEVMCHPDFPSKVCKFNRDYKNHNVKNKSDTFILSSYTVFFDQMELYASIRKGSSELRSYKLNTIANVELKDMKLDYSDEGDIKTLPYNNFKMFVIYNIKDVLLQMGIERRTTDFDTLYVSSYQNATPYDKVFKQTVKLRNVQYMSFLDHGLIPGSNTNIFNKEEVRVVKDDDDDDDSFDGALVADPFYNGHVGAIMYGERSNTIFRHAVDFDMSAFYPNTIIGTNIDPSTLIFKCIVPADQYNINSDEPGKIPYKGIAARMLVDEEDVAKELFDNFQTGNYTTLGSKWMNLPDIAALEERMEKKLGKG